jgi:hydrogenase expression/formation protein
MSDLEGLSKKLLAKGIAKDKIIQRLVEEYKIYKDQAEKTLIQMASAVLQESINTSNFQSLQPTDNNFPSKLINQILKIPSADVKMGDGGVGCRGIGDFFVHKLIARLSQTSNSPLIAPDSLDDTGAVEWGCDSDTDSEENKGKKLVILSKMEGMHSRLSDFPFLAGFHVTRAALRDIYVKGGIPISIMVDVHLADDGDIGKLFDFQAGIAAVAELANVPITAGSTLRIGGDMVIGDRLTGGIAAIGVMKHSFFRKNIQKDDVILMTEGAGGGTICTTALYSNEPEIITETMNIKFLKACNLLFADSELCNSIHSMADVTNGGLRGDLYEINTESGFGAQVYPTKVKSVINSNVLAMLENKQVDYLGVSLDALLLFCKPDSVKKIINLLKTNGIQIVEIGKVIEEQKVVFVSDSGEQTVVPRFRESAYTKIKEVVDTNPVDFEEMKLNITAAYQAALKKRDDIVEIIRKSSYK